MARKTERIDLLCERLHYHVWADLPKDMELLPNINGVPLSDIADALPHGSGLDSDWHVTLRRDGGLTLRTEWHAMNEHGYYTGYYPVMVVVDSTLAVTDVRVNSRATNDVGEYLAETVQYALDELTKKLCPVCGVRITLVGETKDGRLIGSCRDAFTKAQWEVAEVMKPCPDCGYGQGVDTHNPDAHAEAEAKRQGGAK